MRGHQNRQLGGGGVVVNANNINITSVTNVTNITNVTHVASITGGAHQGHRGHDRQGGSRKSRPPKLLRFFASGGLLDRDVASRMSNDDIARDGANIVGYSARNLGGCISRGAEGAVDCACGLVQGAFQAIGSLLSIFG